MENDKEFSFEKLDVYKYARALVRSIYKMIKDFPKEEQYALCDQLRRAVTSVPSNIAEGMSRLSPKEQLHFLEIAYGSLMEVLCQTTLAYDLGYIDKSSLREKRGQIYDTSKLLLALHYSLEKNKPINR